MNSILFGEVKWSIKPVGTDGYEDLKRKARMVEWGKTGRKEFFCLFSKSGFTENLVRKARDEGVFLFKEEKRVDWSCGRVPPG